MSQLLSSLRIVSLVLSDSPSLSILSSISNTNYRDTGSVFKAPKASNTQKVTQGTTSRRTKRNQY